MANPLAGFSDGWRVTVQRNTHVRLLSPDGRSVVVVSKSYKGSQAASKRIRCLLQKAGLNV